MKQNTTARPTTPEVEAISRLHITGNIIPQAWYHWFRENDRLQVHAMLILSEIIYWYRGVEIVDEETKRVVGMRRKFNEDMLQYSARQFSWKLGISIASTKRSIAWLLEKGYIRQELRTVGRTSGRDGTIKMSNVRYVAPVAEAIAKTLEIPEPEDVTPRINLTRGSEQLDTTYTENTTETTGTEELHSPEKSVECAPNSSKVLSKKDSDTPTVERVYDAMLDMFTDYRAVVLNHNLTMPDEAYASIDATAFLSNSNGLPGAGSIRNIKAVLRMITKFPAGYWSALDHVRKHVYNGATLAEHWVPLSRLYKANVHDPTWALPQDEWRNTMGRYADGWRE